MKDNAPNNKAAWVVCALKPLHHDEMGITDGSVCVCLDELETACKGVSTLTFLQKAVMLSSHNKKCHANVVIT